MDVKTKISDGLQQVFIKGRFTHENKEAFFAVIKDLSSPEGEGVRKTVIDMSGVEFLDSAGLGMLLLLNDEAVRRGSTVVLKNPCGQVEKLFKLSMLENIMTVEK